MPKNPENISREESSISFEEDLDILPSDTKEELESESVTEELPETVKEKKKPKKKKYTEKGKNKDKQKEEDIPFFPESAIVEEPKKEKQKESKEKKDKELEVPKMKNLWEHFQLIKENNPEDLEEECKKIFGKLAGERTYRFKEVDGNQEIQYMRLKLDGQKIKIKDSSEITFEIFDKYGKYLGEETKKIGEIEYCDFKKVEENKKPKKGDKIKLLNNEGRTENKKVKDGREFDNLKVYENEGEIIYKKQVERLEDLRKKNDNFLITPSDEMFTDDPKDKEDDPLPPPVIYNRTNEKDSGGVNDNIGTEESLERYMQRDIEIVEDQIDIAKAELGDLSLLHPDADFGASLRGVVNSFKSSGNLLLRGITGGMLGKESYTEEEIERIGERFSTLREKIETLNIKRENLLKEKSKLNKKWYEFWK